MSDWREQAKSALGESLDHGGYSSLDNFLGALVAAVESIIRADERERIARETRLCSQCRAAVLRRGESDA